MVPVQNTSGPSSVGDFSRSKVRATLPTVASPSFSDKPPHDDGHLGESVLKRADERTRTADLISLRVCGQWLLGVAQPCKSCIDKRLIVLSFAHRCRVLRAG